MTKLIISLILALLLFTVPTLAKETPIVTIQISSDTAKDCTLGVYLWGCALYWQEANGKRTYDKIYISDNLSTQDFEYVFWHEIGHAYLDGEDLTLFNNDPEVAANMFYEFIAPNPICYNTYVDWCGQLSQPMKDLFRKLIIEKEVKVEIK